MNKSKGFTLIELSIVLVIIGLVISGVLTGSEIIEQSKLTKVNNDANNFKAALYTFQLKYEMGELPGDTDKASIWFPNCDSPATNCNGNADGTIDCGSECMRTWQQLADAGILKGEYSGTGSWNPGVNAPKGPFDGTGYKIQTNGTATEIEFNAMDSSCGYCSSLTPLQAYSLDAKFDDGYATGAISASDGRDDSNCSTWISPGLYEYNVAVDSLQCRLKFSFLE